MDCELLEFKRPDQTKSVLVTSFTGSALSLLFWKHLLAQIDQLVLLYSVVLRIDDCFHPVHDLAHLPDEKTAHAMILSLYSRLEAHKLVEIVCNTYEQDGIECRVLEGRLRTNQKQYPLSLCKCIQVANHFLGFDGWSSRLEVSSDRCVATLVCNKGELQLSEEVSWAEFSQDMGDSFPSNDPKVKLKCLSSAALREAFLKLVLYLEKDRVLVFVQDQ